MFVNTPQTTPNRVLVLWIIWFALTSAVVIYQFVLGQGLPAGENAPGEAVPTMAWLGVGMVFIATAIRWLVITRLTAITQQLVAMIVGLSLAESAELFGLLLVPDTQPETKLTLFLLSLFGVLQFAPIYAKKG